MRKRKTIFISYSVGDSEKVGRIKRDLTALNYDIWIYPQSIDPGDNIIEEEADAIDKSDIVLFMLSKNSLSSSSVQKEIRFYKRWESRTGKKKGYGISIDKEVDLRENTIQKCDFSDSLTYASEFARLIRKIETHRNCELQYGVRDDPEADNWFEVMVWLESNNLQRIQGVEYHIHGKIAQDPDTSIRKIRRGKNFTITFYTPHNEVVFAVVHFSDNTSEYLTLEVELT